MLYHNAEKRLAEAKKNGRLAAEGYAANPGVKLSWDYTSQEEVDAWNEGRKEVEKEREKRRCDCRH